MPWGFNTCSSASTSPSPHLLLRKAFFLETLADLSLSSYFLANLPCLFIHVFFSCLLFAAVNLFTLFFKLKRIFSLPPFPALPLCSGTTCRIQFCFSLPRGPLGSDFGCQPWRWYLCLLSHFTGSFSNFKKDPFMCMNILLHWMHVYFEGAWYLQR